MHSGRRGGPEAVHRRWPKKQQEVKDAISIKSSLKEVTSKPIWTFFHLWYTEAWKFAVQLEKKSKI